MPKKYLAHIADTGQVQTVTNHLEGTAKQSAAFARAFGAEEAGCLVGLAHDIGKFSDAFQRRLHGSLERVDHSTAGASECFRLGQPYAAFAVAGHHGGLPDGGGQGDHPDHPTFFGRMNRAKQGHLEPYDAWCQELSLPQAPLPAIDHSSPLESMFFTRMLYSCLVDADYLDTETFMTGAPQDCGVTEDISTLENRLQQYISSWFPPKTALNKQRCAILKHCLEEGGAQSPGLFTLTVPTGGGKTVASLAFALRHAKTHGLQRIIYVIPYTSIIEQTAQIFRDILGDGSVLEHHCGVDYQDADHATPNSIRLARTAENWDVPVVVTTAVQFFESLYANRSSRCRKLHNLAGSIIIFDEAQMLPIPYLRPCVAAIAQLVKHYGVSAVLCTATQPMLEPIFREFLPKQPVLELCPPGVFRWEDFRRVIFRKAGPLSWSALASQLSKQPQVLCVVNTRKNAQTVFDLLEHEGAFHLSTLMCPAHRQAHLAEIRSRLREGLPCRVVSTSLIEAGVDVDFPAVFREEAGLDSILQAAGRCNREGKRPAEASIVTIFQGENPPPPLFSIPIAAGRRSIAAYEDLSCQEAIEFYFRELRDLKGDAALDQKRILPTMAETLMPFRTVADAFHLIDSPTRTVYIPWRDGAALVDCLQRGERSRALFRKLGQYGVSVYEGHFQALHQTGAVSLLPDDLAILADTTLYSDDVGLSLTVDPGKALFI